MTTSIPRFQRRAPPSVECPIADDLLRGAREIALFVFGSDSVDDYRKIFRLADQKVIPTGKLGGQLIASKRAITKRYEQLTKLTDEVEGGRMTS